MTYFVSCENELDGINIHLLFEDENAAYCEYVKLSNDALINKHQFTTVKLEETDDNVHFHSVAVFDYYY